MAELKENTLREIVLKHFTSVLHGNITLETPLREADEPALRAIFDLVAREIATTGNQLGSLSADDVMDSDKVGKTVGELASAMYKDLKTAVLEDLASFTKAAFRRHGTSAGPGVVDLGSYLAGYRDATMALISHLELETNRGDVSLADGGLVFQPSAELPRGTRIGTKREKGARK